MSSDDERDDRCAPLLRSGADHAMKLAWRAQVSTWVRRVVNAHSSPCGDSQLKSQFSFLAIHLYNALDRCYQSQVDILVRDGRVNINRVEPVLNEILTMVNEVAPDNLTCYASRVVTTFQEVSACTREPGESVSDFAERYNDLAKSYLKTSQNSPVSPISTMLASQLIVNANMSSTELLNMKRELAESSHTNGPIPNTTTVQKSDLNKLQSTLDKLRSSVSFLSSACEQPSTASSSDSPNSPDNANPSELSAKLAEIKEKTKQAQEIINRMKPTSPNASSIIERIRSSAPSALKFYLEDVVNLMKFMHSAHETDPPAGAQFLTRQNVGTIINTCIGLNMLRQNICRCEDCGSITHFTGSADCRRPTFETWRQQDPENNTSIKAFVAYRNSLLDDTDSLLDGIQALFDPNDKVSRCNDCGSKNHVSGHLSCRRPTFETWRRRDPENNTSSEDFDAYRASLDGLDDVFEAVQSAPKDSGNVRRCFDCGSKNHLSGNTKCRRPTFKIWKRRNPKKNKFRQDYLEHLAMLALQPDDDGDINQ